MSSFADRCGLNTSERSAAIQGLLRRLETSAESGGVEQIRVVWSDWHGILRGKVLTRAALAAALTGGIGMVGTLMLKDTADRTAVRVFEGAAPSGVPPGLAQAGNVRLMLDPASFTVLPWSPGSAWIRAEPWLDDATPVRFDPRRLLQGQLARLAERGLALRVGVELEFHVYRLVRSGHVSPADDPRQSAWPPPTPEVCLTHPGYQLLGDDHADQLDEVFTLLRQVAQGLQMPLLSLEVELGPSQVEAVFDVQEGLMAADQVLWFRHAAKQALRRAGYLVSFMCKPPFENAVASGWHLHQSVVAAGGQGLWQSGGPAAASSSSRSPSPSPSPASESAEACLGVDGAAWLAGLLAHAPAMAAFASPTISGFGRFQGSPMSPLHAAWGRDNRGAMLRVIPHGDGTSAHIENRLGEPAANPYLYLASQIAAGLDGMDRALVAPPASFDPYGSTEPQRDPGTTRLPADLGQALQALAADPLWTEAFGAEAVELFLAIKRAELARFAQATDPVEWQRREYFARL